MMNNVYPQFYKKNSLFILRKNDLEGEQIRLAIPYKEYNVIRTTLTYPDKNRFDSAVMGMEIVSKEIYDHFLQAYRELYAMSHIFGNRNRISKILVKVMDRIIV